MRCPFCASADLKVTDSRDAADSNAIKRRRQCQQCSRRFTTFETVELTLQVHKRDGRYEDFQRTKLTEGLLAACHHTTVSNEQVEKIVDTITFELIQSQQRCITTKELGEMTIQKLLHLDQVAYIRFACVYWRFKQLGDIEQAINQLHACSAVPSDVNR